MGSSVWQKPTIKARRCGVESIVAKTYEEYMAKKSKPAKTTSGKKVVIARVPEVAAAPVPSTTPNIPGLLIEWVPVDSIKPYDRNARKNDDAVAAVARSIETFGWTQPIVVDVERVIIIGHTRWKAAKLRGDTSVPITIAKLSKEKVKQLRIADNKLHEIAEWDIDLLRAELAEQPTTDWTVAGFSAVELAKLQTEQEAKEKEAKTSDAIAAIGLRHEVVAITDGEAGQKTLYDRLTGEGYKCRILTY